MKRLAKRHAERKGPNKTDAVKLALEDELGRLEDVVPLKDRLRPIQERVQMRPPLDWLQTRRSMTT